jgi:choline kinase
MQAVILAAGAGTRVGLNLPKCLIEINGKTLLQNQIETLNSVDDTVLISVVTGYKNRLVDQAVFDLQKKYPLVKTIYNSEAQNLGIVRSLDVANEAIVESSVLRLSGDLYFTPDTNLEELVTGGDALAVQNIPPTRNETVVIRNEDLVLTNEHGGEELEWLDVDFYSADSFKKIMRVSHWYSEFNQHYYQLLRHAIKAGTYAPRFVEIRGVYEIDTPEDLQHVQASI